MLMVVVRMEGGLYRVLLQRTFQSESSWIERILTSQDSRNFGTGELRGRKKGRFVNAEIEGNGMR